jgi:sugar lactone lactonase YvrE
MTGRWDCSRKDAKIAKDDGEMKMGNERLKWVVIWVSLLMVALVVGILIRARNATVAPEKAAVAAVESGRSNAVIGVECPAIPSPVAESGALAVDVEGRIYVGGLREVAVLGADGKLIGKFAVEKLVTCLAVDEDGSVLVGMGDRIEVCDREGVRAAQWVVPGTNAILTSLALDEDGVYAADAGQHCVWRLDRRGKVVGVIRRTGGEFVIPSPYFDMAIGTGDGVWVVDPGRHEVVNYAPDGTVRTSWGRSGSEADAFCGCCNPIHIALLADGSFVTAEKGIPRVKRMSASGELIGMIAGPDAFVGGTRVADVAVDGKGRVLVLDPLLKVIRVFDMTRAGRN